MRADARFPGSDGRAIARLKAGVTLEEANADVARMIPLLCEEFNRNANSRRVEVKPMLRSLKDTVVGDLGETLWILMGTIGLLLLIACAKVANLMLVRTHSRRGARLAAGSEAVFAGVLCICPCSGRRGIEFSAYRFFVTIPGCGR